LLRLIDLPPKAGARPKLEINSSDRFVLAVARSFFLPLFCLPSSSSSSSSSSFLLPANYLFNETTAGGRARENRGFATDIDRPTRASVDMNFIVNAARTIGGG
jgi:hypothetical protein